MDKFTANKARELSIKAKGVSLKEALSRIKKEAEKGEKRMNNWTDEQFSESVNGDYWAQIDSARDIVKRLSIKSQLSEGEDKELNDAKDLLFCCGDNNQ